MKIVSPIATSFFVLIAACAARAQDEAALPIYERDPYDLITVDEANGGGTYKVLPLELPNRKLPVNPTPDSLLKVRMLDDRDTVAEIAWKHIAKVELFEQLVLADAQRLTAAQNFEAAYEHLAFLHENYPQLAGLAEATREFRYRNAGALFRQARYAEALALLEEIHREEPQRSGLAAALANVSQPLFDAYRKQERCDAARQLVDRTARRSDEASLALARSWQTQLEADACAQEQLARQRFTAQQFRAANEHARAMLAIWPELPGGRKLAGEIAQRWPVVRIGVGQTAPTMTNSFALERCARRVASLTSRPLAVLSRFGPDGPVYTSPWGEITVAENRRSITLESEQLTGYDMTDLALSAADRDSQRFDPLWASLLKSASVDEVRRAQLDLRRAHPQPLAVLTSLEFRPRYMLGKSSAAQSEYLAGDDVRGPREVIEIATDSPPAALAELRRGRLDVIERIAPADAAALAKDEALRVGRYTVPSVHVLVPNHRRPAAASATLRRALAYATPRERILRDELLAGAELDGCRVLSGPFPTSASPVTWAEGYDRSIEPLAYEPRMALTLSRVAEDEAARAAQQRGAAAPPRQPIVVGHGPDALHRRACEAIVEAWTRIGLSCERKQLASGDEAEAAACDFYYLELSIHEPVVDAVRLLGEGGLIEPSAYLMLAVRDVMNATNAAAASERLHALHATAHAEQAVIPLWQLVDHFAYRADLSGVESELVSLYGQIDQWQFAAEPSP